MKIKLICLLLLLLATLHVVVAYEDFVAATLQQPGDEVDILGTGDEKVAATSQNETKQGNDIILRKKPGGIVDDGVTVDAASNLTARTGRNPQTGKEIQIAAGSATISIDDNVYHTNVRVSVMELLDVTASSEHKCGISKDNKVVCVVTPFDDSDAKVQDEGGNIYCWGSNEFKECPDEEIQSSRGSGGGKVSVEDITIKSKGGGAGKVSISDVNIGSRSSDDGIEFSIEAYFQGFSEPTDSDNDDLEFIYVWTLNGEPKTSVDNSSSSGTLNFNFENIKIDYYSENGSGIIEVNIPSMTVSPSSLVFTSISFNPELTKENDTYCGKTVHLLRGGDCDDTDIDINPGTPAERADSEVNKNQDYLDVDDDGDEVLTAQQQATSPDTIMHQGRILDDNAFATSGRFGSYDCDGVAQRCVLELSDEDKEDIRKYLRIQSELRGADFGLAMAYAMSGNERVREVSFDNNTGRVYVEEEREVRLFGFIPMRARTTTLISDDGTVEERKPWWTALARASSTEPIKWMQPENIQAIVSGDFEYCPDGSMVETLADCPDHVDASAQVTGEEVDIIGMGEEKISDNKETAVRTGRNPQTGKEIKIAAKRIDKATPALAQASAHVREGDAVESVEVSLQVRSVALEDGDKIVCGVLAHEGTPSCMLLRDNDHSIWCWGSNERSLTQESCPTERELQQQAEQAVGIDIERMHARSSSSSFEVLKALRVDDLSMLLVVHTGDVPDQEEVAMNKAELIEAIASQSQVALAGGFLKIEGVEGESRAGIPPSIAGIEVTSSAMLQEDGLYLNLQDWDLPSNSLVFVEVAIGGTPNGDKIVRILRKKLPE